MIEVFLSSQSTCKNRNQLLISVIHICYLPAGRSVLGKTVPEVLSTARGHRTRAVLKTEGTVFLNTDRPKPENNVFIFSLGNYIIRNICVDFLLKQFHTVRGVRMGKSGLLERADLANQTQGFGILDR